jgi:ABC-2 type transport system permease protein
VGAITLPDRQAHEPGRLPELIDLEAILMLSQRDLTRFLRERAQLYGSLARTVVWLFILGAGLRGVVAVPAGVSYLAYVFPGMLAMAVIFASLQSAIGVIFDREFGFLKEILVAPVPRTSIVLGKALAGAVIATVQGTLVFVFAPISGVPLSVLSVLGCVAVMLLTGLGLTAAGLAVAARMTSFEGFGTVNNFVVLPLYFASGAQFPLELAPEWLRVVALFNPLTYSVDLLRGLLLGIWTFPPAVDVLVLTGFAIGALATATVMFTRQE